MKTARKAILLVLCVICLVVASVMGTLAYLTDDDSVTNTFTVGKIGITLDEAKANLEGKPVDANGGVLEDVAKAPRVQANEYHLLPGHEYVKDPTVTVLANSADCYVRMMVTINKQDELDDIFEEINEGAQTPITIQNVLTGWDNAKWELFAETEKDNERVYEFRYYDTVKKSDQITKLAPLFTKIEMPGAITKEQLATLYTENAANNLKITVVAHAIQADGFDTADAAWAAFAA